MTEALDRIRAWRLALVETALRDYGVVETAGPSSTPRIMEMAKEVGTSIYTNDGISWCGLAMAAWVKRAGGAPPSGFLSARHWLDWGVKVETPEVGDIAVLWRNDPKSWEGHVGIFLAKRGGVLYLLGGNQSNTVSVAAYRADRLLAFRRAF